MKPTQPNKTRMATAADIVLTKESTAKWIVDHYNDYTGILLDPSVTIYQFAPK